MKNYAVLEGMKRHQKTVLDDAFNKGYEQGYRDGKLDGEAENLEKLEKSLDAEKEAEYQRGYEQGRRSTITIKDFEEYYHKGLKHGQELRAEEVKCAEACGMKRAWDVARKILSRHGEGYDATDMEVFGTDDVFSLSASEAVEKLETWEKKNTTTSCRKCIHAHKFTCDAVPCVIEDGHCDKYEEKQDAPETNVESIENRDKIVKAIAGLWAAYGEQLWDVVADMQKNLRNECGGVKNEV